MEALACGCRLIATSLPGVMELFGENINNDFINIVKLPKLYDTDKMREKDEKNFMKNLKSALLDHFQSISIKFEIDNIKAESVLKKYRCEQCDGCFKQVYFLVDYPGVAVAEFGVAAPINAMMLDLAIEWGVNKFISVGGACSFQKYLKNGDIVVCDKAIRNEGLSHHYLPPEKYVHSSGKIKDKLFFFPLILPRFYVN